MGEPKSQIEILIDQKAKLVSSMGYEFEEHLIKNAKQQGSHGELSFIFQSHPMHDYYEQRLQYHCQRNQTPVPQSKQQKPAQLNQRKRSRSRDVQKKKRSSSTPSSSYSRSGSSGSSSSRSRDYSSSSKNSSYSKSSSSSIDKKDKYKSPQKHQQQQRYSHNKFNNFNKAGLTDTTGGQHKQQEVKLDELSIGQIISLLRVNQKSQITQSKDYSRVFYPYQVLNNYQTNPKQVEKIKNQRPTTDALDALDDFLDYIKNFDELSKEEQQTIAKDKYSGGKDYKSLIIKSKSKRQDDGRLRIQDEEDEEDKDQRSSKHLRPQEGDTFKSTLLQEMGISEEGAAIGGPINQKRGLGSSGRDVFEQYRLNRSNRYHVAAEERSKGIKEEELCYICQKPGHYAKDCKYGIN